LEAKTGKKVVTELNAKDVILGITASEALPGKKGKNK
jgi:hypothetical protein